MPDYGVRTFTTEPSYFRRSHAVISVGDRHEATKNFVVSAYLALSRHTPRVEKHDRQSTVDPSEWNPAADRPGALAFASPVARSFRPAIWPVDGSVSFSWTPA